MLDFPLYPEEIFEDFPNATKENHAIKSERTPNHNCLAFAVGDLYNWWDVDERHGYYWPPGFPREATVVVVIHILEVHGFTIQISSESELSRIAKPWLFSVKWMERTVT